MTVQNTDYLVVDRGGVHYKAPAGDLLLAKKPPAQTSPMSPSNPQPGNLWFDTANNDLMIYVGSKWIPVISVSNIQWERIGTGTIRSVEDKLRERISVKDFGAKGDGMVDDTAAIQSAINTLKPWSKLYFPSGEYRISAPLTLPNDGFGNAAMILEGDGYSSHIFSTGTHHLFFPNEVGLATFRAIRFSKTGAGIGTGNAIHFAMNAATNNGIKGGYLLVERCYFENLDQAIRCYAPNVTITGNVIKNCKVGFGSYGFSNNCFIYGNNIKGNIELQVGIKIRPADITLPASPTGRTIILSNSVSFEGKNGTPLQIFGGNTHFVFNNDFRNEGISDVDNTYDIGSTIYVSSAISGNVFHCQNVQIKNNTIKSAGKYLSANFGGIGINVAGVATKKVEDIIIENNAFYTKDASGCAVYLNMVDGYRVSNNYISGTSITDEIGVGYVKNPIIITTSSNGNVIGNGDRYTTTSNFNLNLISNPIIVRNNLKANWNSVYFGGNYNEFTSKSDKDYALIVANARPGGFDGQPVIRLNIVNDIGRTNNGFLEGADSLGVNYMVLGTGSVSNKNNSYGAMSDGRLKTDIVSAQSQWDILKKLNLYNYTLKDDVTKKKQIGLLAQEVETIAPEMVTDGLDGIKTINYFDLYLRSVGVLQEVIESIEELEKKLYNIKLNKNIG
jgi:hypothetical protein